MVRILYLLDFGLRIGKGAGLCQDHVFQSRQVGDAGISFGVACPANL